MSARYAIILSKRGARDDDGDGSHFGGWFYSEEGRKVRYGIFLGIIVFFIVFVLVSYQHAQIRMNKGLAPLPYHSWLISSHRRSQFAPEDRSEIPRPSHPEDNFSFYQNGHQLYAVPPPAYNPNFVQPPSYPGPPEGAIKTAPQQHPPPAYHGNGHDNSVPAAGPSSSAEQRH
ncbi:hypothetical protein EV426DRAFT_87882 [Tirmania nivea]|nr:hypothetical protein EV426DRAFT_87882 [Tirmania nivea]